MQDTIDPSMSKQEFAVSYSGSGREDDHSIDVQSLAPALLAFGRLLREANNEFNSKKSTSKVLVVSDFEHKCFNINFELVVSLYDQIKSLIGTDSAKSAKEILEWVGILGTPTIGFGMSYLQYLRWRKGRKIEEVRPLTDADKTGFVEVRIHGDSNAVHVHQHVHNLSENAAALRATRDTFLPLGRDGFDTVQLKQDSRVIEEIGNEHVADIVASCNVGIDESKETEPEIEYTPAWLSVYSPVYDPSAVNWRFRLGKEIIYADISQTDIAQQAIDRGGTLVDDAYQVRLQITTEVDSQGKKKGPHYKIVDVIRFVPAPPPSRQAALFEDKDS